MSSIPRAVEKQYDGVDSEIVDKLDFEPYLQLLKSWLKNFAHLRESLGELDGLSQAECYLLLESLKCSAQILKARATGAEVSDSIIAYTREVGFVYEQFLLIHNQLKAQRAQRLQKILAATQEEGVNTSPTTTTTSDGAAAKQQQSVGMSMNLKNLLPEDGESGDGGEKSEIYKAPQSSTLSILGTNFNAEDKARRKESKQHTAARLNRSEFVTALTEDYTETPLIHDDGFDQLDAESRKTLEKFEAQDRLRDDDDSDGYTMPMKRSRKTSELKKYQEIKTKQSLLRSGAGMGDLADFVGRINNEDNETTLTEKHSSNKKSGKKIMKNGKKKSSRTKLPKIKKRVK